MAKEESSDKEVSAIIRVEGGTADEGMLEIYDAASMIHGVARAINIVAHSFSTDEQEIRVKAHTARGVKTLLHSSKKGCFEEQVDIVFSQKLASRIGPSVIVSNFWDYLMYCWSAAIGNDYDPTSSHLRKITSKDEDFFYIIGDALESAMQDVHKPISRDSKVKIYLARPRVGDVLQFNKESLAYITTRIEESEMLTFTGNVTRFNVLSDFGRLYSNKENRIVSFKLAEKNNKAMQKSVVQSMQDRIAEKGGKLKFHASQVLGSQGLVKRYVVHDIEAENAE
jgi:hypothetical protein